MLTCKTAISTNWQEEKILLRSLSSVDTNVTSICYQRKPVSFLCVLLVYRERYGSMDSSTQWQEEFPVFACGLRLSIVLECGKRIEFSNFLLSSVD